MYELSHTRTFERSLRRLKASGQFKGKTKTEFASILARLENGANLPVHNEDHALTGEWRGYRDCHIRGNLLLVYRKDERARMVVLVDIGNHANIFG
ncbi:MAG: type II toxin-antitoxin system YafQ family toxin [Candidatus Yanofskybacteria bacterium]|nr:type II toxin-antitoxin system YafQ family toxin [Candidatus Yanofskybacteria bacterium]